MVYVIVLVLLVGTVWLVAGPLLQVRPESIGGNRGDRGGATDDARAERRIDLEAARDAKYREIRDAELDHQTGKLSAADYNAIDSTLRAEALELLRELDKVVDLAGVDVDDAAGDSDQPAAIGQLDDLDGAQ